MNAPFSEPVFCGKLEWIGWDAPTVELVARRLRKLNRENPEAFRRAMVVVPSAESGRRLRECMAEKPYEEHDKHVPLLMPKIGLPGQLLPSGGCGVASEYETLAAWLQVLQGEKGETLARFAPLIPLCPETHVERWRVGVALKLMALRQRLEQEEMETDAVTSLLKQHEEAEAEQSPIRKQVYAQEGLRWRKLGELFAKVDACLRARVMPAEEFRRQFVEHPAWPGSRRLLILACVPELSPQLKRYLSRLHGCDGGEVRIWVNAPEEEKDKFDSFGIPLESAWCDCDIEIPGAFAYKTVKKEDGQDQTVVLNNQSRIHLVDDAVALAGEVRRLCGGKNSDEVVIAVGDTQYTAPVISAFENPEQGGAWLLNSPEGRSFTATEVGALAEQLADLCAARADFRMDDTAEGGMVELNAFVRLLCNRALQRVLKAPACVAVGLQEHVEALRAVLLPASVQTLCRILSPEHPLPEDNRSVKHVARSRRAEYAAYAAAVADFADGCCVRETLPEKLKELGGGLLTIYQDTPLQKAVTRAVGVLQAVCGDAFLNRTADAVTMLEVIRRKTHDTAAGVQNVAERKECVGDVLGWREVPFARGKNLVLAAMHEGAVPEPVAKDEFLPRSLCEELGIRHEKFRTARDSFILTALLNSRPAEAVHFVVARQNPDNSVVAPSSLLLRCGADLPQRARAFFAESTQVGPAPKVPHCPLKIAAPAEDVVASGGDKLLPGMMEDIHQLVPEVDAPYLTWRSRRTAGEREVKEREFSPSLLSGFLQCPLSFWMKQLMGLDAGNVYDENKSEPESNEYGSLIHAVLERLVRTFPSAEILAALYPEAETAAQKERKMLETALQMAHEEWQKIYPPVQQGQYYTLPMQVQLDTLAELLKKFVRRHAEDLEQGWCNVACEYKLTPKLTLSDGRTVSFNMIADRIDRHRDGRWRIIDYKTSTKVKHPFKVHFEALPEGEESPFALFMNAKGYSYPTVQLKRNEDEFLYYRWADVQLMLYTYGFRLLKACDLQADLPDEPLTDALPDLFYYNLQIKDKKMECFALLKDGALRPVTINKKQAVFSHTPDELLANAMTTVDSAIRMILDGKCLFSAESLGLKKPFSKLTGTQWSSSAPRFGALSPQEDPRSLFCLPELEF